MWHVSKWCAKLKYKNYGTHEYRLYMTDLGVLLESLCVFCVSFQESDGFIKLTEASVLSCVRLLFLL